MRRLLTAALAAALCSAILSAPAAALQVPVRMVPDGILLNFQDVDLAYAITALAQAAGINVVYTDLPQKQVTLRTARAVSAEDVGALIRRLAEAHGVTVTEESGFVRLQGQAVSDGQLAEARQLYIYRLRHARAPVLATTLQTLFGGVTFGAPARGHAATTLSQQLRIMEQQAAQQAAAQQRAGQMAVVPPQIVIGGRPGELESNVQIVPDELTNALLVRATPSDWQIVQQAVQALDLRPLQVVIEVVIAEVQRTNDLNVGVGFSATDPDGGTRRNTEGQLLRADNMPDDFTLRIVRSGDINIEATLSALASTGNVRILSRPVIQAQNNQEARILVGSERPFVQVSRSLPTGEPVRDQVVQYRDVGTSLTIVPTINDDGYVNLLVTQEVSSATNEIQFDAPVISTREASTQLLARNGQTVVIGGLVDRQSDRTRSGIPFLKDIPILGYLFGSTRETTANSELFLFLTPYIVGTDEDADRVREEIERQSELLKSIVPIRPITPPVVRIPADTSGIRR